jgi:small subunit ribosomal protein S6
MRSYELVTIVNPEADDEGMRSLMDRVNRFITEKDGIVEGTEQWGKKKLAYPIRRFLEGNYSLTRLKLEPRMVKELEMNLGAEEEILRHLVVLVGD